MTEAAMRRARRVIFSGAPGAGKTTLLNTLAARGYHVVEESARAIIRDRLGRDLPPRPAPRQFAADVMRRDIENYHKQLARPDWVFFDRAIPDGMCMLDQIAPLGRRKIEVLAERFVYHRQVFMFPPWAAIYCNDAERDQSFADATRIFRMLGDWYRQCGYEVVDMPLESVDDRCDLVLKTLGLDCAKI
jgi:predicted ATPase